MAVPMANDPPFATLNHFAADLGIPSESDLLRIGIRRQRPRRRMPRRFFSLLSPSLRTYAKPPLIPVQVGSTRAFTRVFDALWAAVRSSGSPPSWGRAEWNSLMRCALARNQG